MADWTDIGNAAVAKGGLPSGETMTAIRDNIIAQAEGAPGAPKTVAAALGGLYLGQIDSVNYAGLSDLDGISELLIIGEMWAEHTTSINGARLRCRLSTDNGSSWDGNRNILNEGNADFLVTSLMLNLETGDYTAVISTRDARNISDFVQSGTITIPAGGPVNAFQIATVSSTANRYTRAQVFGFGGKTV